MVKQWKDDDDKIKKGFTTRIEYAKSKKAQVMAQEPPKPKSIEKFTQEQEKLATKKVDPEQFRSDWATYKETGINQVNLRLEAAEKMHLEWKDRKLEQLKIMAEGCYEVLFETPDTYERQ